MGLIVPLCLTASSVNAAAKQKSEEAPQLPPEAQQQVQQAQQQVQQLQQEQQQLQQVQQAQQQAAALQQQTQSLQSEAQRPAGPEPELNIPIRYFVYSAILGGLGYATGIFSRGPERDLRNPAQHATPDDTQSLYRKAYYGGLISKGFYSLSGAMGGLAAYKTQSAIRSYLTAKARLAAREREMNQRLAQAKSPEEKKAVEMHQALLEPPTPAGTELLVMAPEPPPLQASFAVGPSGEGALSLSVRF
jgi:hypothetical protein